MVREKRKDSEKRFKNSGGVFSVFKGAKKAKLASEKNEKALFKPIPGKVTLILEHMLTGIQILARKRIVSVMEIQKKKPLASDKVLVSVDVRQLIQESTNPVQSTNFKSSRSKTESFETGDNRLILRSQNKDFRLTGEAKPAKFNLDGREIQRYNMLLERKIIGESVDDVWTVRTYCRGRTEIRRWGDSDDKLTGSLTSASSPKLHGILAERRLSQIDSLD